MTCYHLCLLLYCQLPATFVDYTLYHSILPILHDVWDPLILPFRCPETPLPYLLYSPPLTTPTTFTFCLGIYQSPVVVVILLTHLPTYYSGAHIPSHGCSPCYRRFYYTGTALWPHTHTACGGLLLPSTYTRFIFTHITGGLLPHLPCFSHVVAFCPHRHTHLFICYICCITIPLPPVCVCVTCYFTAWVDVDLFPRSRSDCSSPPFPTFAVVLS